MNQLPKWILTGTFPAVYDAESDTAIQMVAKLYGAMQEQINDFNDFVDSINKTILNFTSESTSDQEQFKTCITNLIQNYIKSIDLKISIQDDKISAAEDYMRENIILTASEIVNNALSNGDIRVGLNYVSETEDLNLVADGTGTDQAITYDSAAERIDII